MAATSTIVLVLIAAATANAQCDFSGLPTSLSTCFFSDSACAAPDTARAAVEVANDYGLILNPTRPNCWDLDTKKVYWSLNRQFYSCNETKYTLGWDISVNAMIAACAFPGKCYLELNDNRTTDCDFTNTNTNTTTTTGDAHRNQPSTLLAMLYIFIPMGLIPAAVAACGRR
jgi:hypothetical protein